MSSMRKISYRNRSRFEIIAEILGVLRKPTVRTNIMSHCNLNSTQSEGYLSFMRSNNLVRTDAVAGRVTYQRTEVGREFLGLFNSMNRLLETGLSVAPPT